MNEPDGVDWAKDRPLVLHRLNQVEQSQMSYSEAVGTLKDRLAHLEGRVGTIVILGLVAWALVQIGVQTWFSQQDENRSGPTGGHSRVQQHDVSSTPPS